MCKKIKQLFIKYPILPGCIVIGVLIFVIFIYRSQRQQDESDIKIISKELQREATIEGFEKPSDMVQYMVHAMQKKDLDLVLRGFAIDELTLGLNIAECIDEKGRFSTESTVIPSYAYYEYLPLASVELVGDYIDTVEKVGNDYPDLEEMEFIEAVPILPEQQLLPESIMEMKTKSKIHGAECECEYMALLSKNEKKYVITFTLMRNYGLWKVLDLGQSLNGKETEDIVNEITEEEYQKLKGAASEDTFLKRIENDKKKEQESIEIEEKYPDEDILSANYFIVNAAYGENPEDTMRKFILEIQRKNIVGALNYTYVTDSVEEREHTTKEILNKQRDLGKEIKRLYYGLLDSDYKKERDIIGLGKTGTDIVGMLNPEYIPYMDMNKVVPTTLLSADNHEENEYVALYYFGEDCYMGGVTFIETERGWQIKSLAAESAGFEAGEIRKITHKKYEELLGLE